MNFRFNILFILIVFISISSFAQTRKDLENKKKQTQKEIEYINNLLKQNQKNAESSYNNLLIINKKISLQENLIASINSEIKFIDTKIADTKNVVTSLEADLKKIKEEYAKMIYFAYVNRSSYDKLMFIMSAEDFNQAYKRLKYLQYYSQYRQQQAESIKKTQETLSRTIAELEKNKEEKKELIKIQQEENIVLGIEKKQQDEVIISLQSKEKELKEKLEMQVLARKKLDKQIEEIIAREIREAEERAKKAAANSTTKKGNFALTPAEKIISDNFGANKGFLPWPTERGVITGAFGEHPHPVLKNIKVQNNGIDISTEEGSIARAIFEGEVSKIVTIGPANKAVLIRHGNFFTLYSNLKETLVKAGDKVSTKQTIGIINTVKEENKTTLHLEIWQESTKLNPASWLSKM